MATLATPAVAAPEAEKAGLNEPSMEDILASIRRIIAEDQSNSLGRSGLGGLTRRAAAVAVAPAVQPAPAPAETVKPDDSVPMQGTAATRQSDADRAVVDDIRVPQAEAPVVPAPAAASVEAHDSAAPPIADVFAVPEPAAPVHDAWADEAPLISPSAGDSITSSFHALAETVLLQDPDMVERVTRDVLRPMLKTWLDDNLPSIVERLVRVEIERVARGGRGRD